MVDSNCHGLPALVGGGSGRRAKARHLKGCPNTTFGWATESWRPSAAPLREAVRAGGLWEWTRTGVSQAWAPPSALDPQVLAATPRTGSASLQGKVPSANFSAADGARPSPHRGHHRGHHRWRQDDDVGTADIPPGQQGQVFADKQLKGGRAGVADGVDADALPGHVLRPTATSNTASPSTPCRRGETSIAREPWRAARTIGSERTCAPPACRSTTCSAAARAEDRRAKDGESQRGCGGRRWEEGSGWAGNGGGGKCCGGAGSGGSRARCGAGPGRDRGGRRPRGQSRPQGGGVFQVEGRGGGRGGARGVARAGAAAEGVGGGGAGGGAC